MNNLKDIVHAIPGYLKLFQGKIVFDYIFNKYINLNLTTL